MSSRNNTPKILGLGSKKSVDVDVITRESVAIASETNGLEKAYQIIDRITELERENQWLDSESVAIEDVVDVESVDVATVAIVDTLDGEFVDVEPITIDRVGHDISFTDVLDFLFYHQAPNVAIEDIGLGMKIEDIDSLKFLLDSSPQIEKIGHDRYGLSTQWLKANDMITFKPLPMDTLANCVKNIKECEKISRHALDVIGYALTVIKVRKLHKGRGSFEEFCLSEFSYSKSYAHRMIKAYLVMRDLESMLDVPGPNNESQLRVLTGLDLDFAYQIYNHAYLQLNRIPGASELIKAKNEILGIKPEPAKPEPAKVEPGKPEPAKVEPGKPEPAKVEPGKPEPGKVESGKLVVKSNLTAIQQQNQAEFSLILNQIAEVVKQSTHAKVQTIGMSSDTPSIVVAFKFN